MITAKEGILLSNGVFLQEGNNIKITFIDGEIIEGKIEYFFTNGKGMVIFYNFINGKPMDEYDLSFNEYIKDIQLAQ